MKRMLAAAMFAAIVAGVGMMSGPRNIVIMDESGNTAHISTYDVNQSNGVIQVIDRVLLPKM